MTDIRAYILVTEVQIFWLMSKHFPRYTIDCFTAGEVQGYPNASWSRNVSKSGEVLYCLQRYNNSLMFEVDLGFLSKVTMIGFEVKIIASIYQNFEVKYSTDGVIWSTYNQGWNLTVRYVFH